MHVVREASGEEYHVMWFHFKEVAILYFILLACEQERSIIMLPRSILVTFKVNADAETERKCASETYL